MQDFISQQSKTDNPLLSYKMQLENVPSILEPCNNRCINSFEDASLTVGEKECLSRCFQKALEMNLYLTSELTGVMNRLANK